MISMSQLQAELAEWQEELDEAIMEMADFYLYDDDDNFDYADTAERIETATYWINDIKEKLDELYSLAAEESAVCIRSRHDEDWLRIELELDKLARMERYPRKQYEADRAKAIADGVEPRLIMSYQACLAWDAWQEELEREYEWAEAYDDAAEEWEIAKAAAEYEEEIEATLETAEVALKSALSELLAFGYVEPPSLRKERKPLNDAESAASADSRAS